MKPKLKVVFRVDNEDNVFGIFPEDLIGTKAGAYSHVSGYFDICVLEAKKESKPAPKARAMKMLEQFKNLSGYENVELIIGRL